MECKTHGLLPTAVNSDACPIVVAEHWIIAHGGRGAAIQGRDWVAYPALQRCDVCGVPVELPAWSHTAKDGPLGLEEMEDLDGRWLLCDACHAFFIAGKIGAWVRHWLGVSQTITDYPPSRELDMMLREEMALRLRVLLDQLDEGARFPW